MKRTDERVVEYYYTDDCDLDVLMKMVRDPEIGELGGYVWNYKETQWKEHWDLVCGYFGGFEPARKITAEEAMEYMVRKGLDRKKAEVQIEKDQKREESADG